MNGAHQSSVTAPRPSHRRRVWLHLGLTFLTLALLIGGIRLALPSVVRDYVNRTLDQNKNYTGRIGEVQIHLWRGAYSIRDISISKLTGDVPVPLFAGERVQFAIEWNALLHRRIVGRLIMDQPELNFVDGGDEAESQTGAGGPWLQIIRDLFPFRINSAIIRDGTVHFRTFQKQVPVDVYLSRVQATVDNLGNIRNETDPLVATVRATGMVMDQAKLDFTMALDPFAYRPTFTMALRIIGLDVTRLNDLALAYGKFDFKRGWFDLVIETDAKQGQVSGYVKPLFRDLKVFSLTEDLKDKNVLEYFWLALVGGVTYAFKNQTRDQFGTRIPFSADATSATSVDLLATLGNIFRNAFVRAYLPRLEYENRFEGIEFKPPDFTDMMAVGGAH